MDNDIEQHQNKKRTHEDDDDDKGGAPPASPEAAADQPPPPLREQPRPRFYSPVDELAPFDIGRFSTAGREDAFSREHVMLMREHYASQEEQTQLEELAILKNNFLRSFSVALRNRERVLRVLDLTVHHYSVPLTAARSTGQVGTWSAFLLDVNYLIGPARRMVTWMEGRGLDVIISLHAFDQGVITHDPKSELLIRPIETSPPLHGQWVTVSGREDRKLAILFARVY